LYARGRDPSAPDLIHIRQPGDAVPASTVLILDTDEAFARSIEATLSRAGYTVTVSSDPDEAYARIVEHQLVVIDVVGGERGAVEFCAEIRKTPAMASVPVLCVCRSDEVEERIGFLEAGADDVVARPFDDRELEARVEALLLRFQRSRDLAPVLSADGLTLTHPRRTIAVYSPKGGVGTTTIATNVAVAAALSRPDRVVLVDLDLQFGVVATHLNLTLRQTLSDVVRDDAAMREPELLRTYACRHASGLHVLGSPATPELAELVTPTHVEHILGTLLAAYETVIIDAGSTLDEVALAAFEAAETVILPVYPEIPALKAVHALLDYLNEAGTIGAKSMFVLNNMFAREILKMRDIEAALGTKVTISLPYDPFLYLKAVNEGIPVVMGAARSPAADGFMKLATAALGVALAPASGTTAARKGDLLSRIRWRG
jgi:pilus assembly protein CpaE